MIVTDEETGIKYKVLTPDKQKSDFWVEMIPCSILCEECNEVDKKLNLFGICGTCQDKMDEVN